MFYCPNNVYPRYILWVCGANSGTDHHILSEHLHTALDWPVILDKNLLTSKRKFNSYIFLNNCNILEPNNLHLNLKFWKRLFYQPQHDNDPFVIFFNITAMTLWKKSKLSINKKSDCTYLIIFKLRNPKIFSLFSKEFSLNSSSRGQPPASYALLICSFSGNSEIMLDLF